MALYLANDLVRFTRHARIALMSTRALMNINSTTLALLGATFATAGVSAIVRRSKRLAIFQTIVLSIHAISSAANFANVIPSPLFEYLNAVVYIQWLSLLRPSLKSNLWRALISFPSSYYSSCTILWFLFTPVSKYFPSTIYIPLVLCFVGLVQTVGIRKESKDIDLVSPTKVPKLAPLKTGIINATNIITRRVIFSTSQYKAV